MQAQQAVLAFILHQEGDVFAVTQESEAGFLQPVFSQDLFYQEGEIDIHVRILAQSAY